MLADWFAWKNFRRHGDIFNVYYYWHDSGSYNYCLHNSPPIWRCTFHSVPSWPASIISTEFYTHKRMIIEIYLHWMIIYSPIISLSPCNYHHSCDVTMNETRSMYARCILFLDLDEQLKVQVLKTLKVKEFARASQPRQVNVNLTRQWSHTIMFFFCFSISTRFWSLVLHRCHLW